VIHYHRQNLAADAPGRSERPHSPGCAGAARPNGRNLMSAFTFVHAADLHLDTPFEGLGRVAPDVAEVLRDSSLAAWDALVGICLERDARLLLLAGDIYDGEERGLRAQLRFLRGLERLAERGVRVAVAHGNHDPHGGRWSAIREWPPGVTVFGHEHVDSVVIPGTEGHPAAIVHGISHASREVTENLSLGFRRSPEPLPQFGLLHCHAGGDPNHPAYAPCSVEDLRAGGMDYWALGHIHRYRVLSAGDPWVVYAGALQGRSAQPGELGVKGAVVGRVAGGRVSDVAFVPVPHVRFAAMEVDIGDVADSAALLDLLQERAQAAQDEAPLVGLAARVTLVGRGPLHADLAAPERAADLLKSMREEADGRVPFLWWSGLVVATRPDLDRDAIRRRGDFSAELLELAAKLRDDPAALARFVEDEEKALHAGALRKLVGAVPHHPGQILEEAETLALERLEGGNGQ
jgi:exonuclease SbcD